MYARFNDLLANLINNGFNVARLLSAHALSRQVERA